MPRNREEADLFFCSVTPLQNVRNENFGKSSGSAVLPGTELGIHGQKAGAATGREKSEKRGVQAARNGPSLPPTPAGGPVAKAEIEHRGSPWFQGGCDTKLRMYLL